MKKSALLLLLVSLSSNLTVTTVNAATVLYPVVVGDHWGYIDKGGKMVIPTQFERAGSFSEGLAEVRLGRWGYVDASGKIVINPQFDHAFAFSDGLAAVDFGGRYGYVDTAGKYVMNPQFDEGGPFFGGGGAFKNKRPSWVVDKKRCIVLYSQF